MSNSIFKAQPFVDYHPYTNYNRFTRIDGDSDTRISVRTFSGRIIKKRWKIISRFCRIRSATIPVYGDYDCTGQLCGHYMTPDFNHNQKQVYIVLTEQFDY